MIAVYDVYSRQNFESMKLAGEVLNIPTSKIKESAEKNSEIYFNNKKYRFRYSTVKETRVFKIRKFPFGKHKGSLIRNCKDEQYLEWLSKQSFVDSHLKIPVKRRLRELQLYK